MRYDTHGEGERGLLSFQGAGIEKRRRWIRLFVMLDAYFVVLVRFGFTFALVGFFFLFFSFICL